MKPAILVRHSGLPPMAPLLFGLYEIVGVPDYRPSPSSVFMDPYMPYECTPDFTLLSLARSKTSHESPQLHLSQEQPQQLPPFREILGPRLCAEKESKPTADSFSSSQRGSMTKRSFHQSSVPAKSEPQSPEHSQTGTSVEGFDSMSTRSVDSTYPMSCHERRSSSWASPSHYPELVNPYNAQQRMQYQPQPALHPHRASPSLPPIRDFDRMNSCESSYPPPTNTYSQAYGTSAGSHGGQENYAYTAEKTSFYDPTQRYGQGYTPTNKPNIPQLDFARYMPSPYDYRTAVTYQSPYGPAEYTSSPTGLHHPSSPTVSTDPDTRNRKRRGNLPRQVTDILRTWFHDHLDHPYPSEEEKQKFMHSTGLTLAQISNWFINARRRQLPALRHARDRSTQLMVADYGSDPSRRQALPDPMVR